MIMRTYKLIVDLVFETSANLAAALGVQDTGAGQVVIECGGSQWNETVQMEVVGEVPAILAYLINEWQDVEEALKAIFDATQDGRLELIK